MKRKDFLKKSFMASLGIAFAPSLLVSCKDDLLNIQTNYQGKVIIVGAGAAGLYAGFILKSLGVDFTIIEASSNPGGRLGKRTDFADFTIDLGAQWLHGKNSIVGDLARASRTIFSKDNSDTVFYYNGQISRSLPKDVNSIVEANEKLPDVSYIDYAISRGLGEDYKYIVEQIAGDFGADSSELSIKWTAIEEEEWNSGNDDFKFEDSFFDLFDKNIIEEIRNSILLNTPIHSIDYANEQIVLTDSNNETYLANKVIVTVPLPILQDGDIQFNPPLPIEKVEAFHRIGMGAGMKVFLKFDTKFYDENIIGGSVSAAYADDSVGKSGTDHVLMAFVMGKQAEALTSLGSKQAITNALLTELDNMYNGMASTSFIASHVEDWTSNPFIRGAYSYSKVGIGNARRIAAQAINNQVFFAGEAMNLNGHHQTVHGAVETGYNSVKELLKKA